jgi:sialic acid synthase SpsE
MKIDVQSNCVEIETEPFIIAEIGSNFNQDIDQAKKLIEASADANANAVKFQLFKAEELYKPEDNLYSVFKSIELNPDWVPILKEFSTELGLEFMASAFDQFSIKVLEENGVFAHKIASSETTNIKLLHSFAKTQKPLIISTGMCDFADVSNAVEICRDCGNEKIILLQCTSLYPSKPRDMNLNVINSFKKYFGFPVGLSDHSLGWTAAVAAIGLGAKVFEKHITLDKNSDGPDHFYSLEPSEFKAYIEQIMEASEALGNHQKEALTEEKAIGRRDGIYASKNISIGEILTEDCLKIERPAIGIRSHYLDGIVGAKASENIAKGQPVKWADLTF